MISHEIGPDYIKSAKKTSNHFQIAYRYFINNQSARIGLFILCLWIFLAIFADQISPFEPNEQDLYMRLSPPDWAIGIDKFRVSHVFGTDQLGRDVLSRVIFGARVSILVGFMATIISAMFGSLLGALAGYFGGKLDEIIMGFADLQMAFPTILLALVIMAVLGTGLFNIILVFAITGWVQYARTFRSEILHIKEQEYITAAKVVGVKDIRMIVRHILPNSLAPLFVIASFQIGQMITQEAALSFLGVGVPSRIPSWGNMLADGREFMTSSWWLSTIPGLCLMSIVVAINFIGDVLRDATDPLLLK